MKLEDGICQLHTNLQDKVLVPSPALQNTIGDSHIRDLVARLGTLQQLETEESVIEEGKRMIMTLKFNKTQNTYSQVVISVTEEALAFCGNVSANQYIRLEKDELRDVVKAEDALAKTVSNPLAVNNA